MELLLQRCKHTETQTTSLLFVDEELFAVVPEDPPQKVKIPGKTRIPAGRYRLTLEHSPKFSAAYDKRLENDADDEHPMLTLVDVPDYVGVRIHILNNAKQTEGCIGPNEQLYVNPDGDDTFGMSERAYRRLYHEVGTFIAQGGEAWITVRDESHLFPGSPIREPLSVA